MLTLFKKAKHQETTDDVAQDSHAMDEAAQRFIEKVTDESTLKKNIEEKLRKYRPVEREADFTKNNLYR